MLEAPIQLDEVTRLPNNEVGLGVLGYPISHSLSPSLHNAALANLSDSDPKFKKWHYSKFELPPERLKDALPLFWDSGYYGLNLTVPHKVEVMNLISTMDPNAEMMGAVNTLVRSEKGWHGCNTDGYGLSAGLKEKLGVDLAGAKVLLLGAGGASRAAAVQCLSSGCEKLWLGNRSSNRLMDVANDLQSRFRAKSIHSFQLDLPPEDLLEADNLIVINATSLGLRENDPAPFDLSLLGSNTKVYEMIYNPPKTQLLVQAESLGFDHASGLSMLVHQAAKALEIWTKREVSVSAMYDGLNAIQIFS